MITPANPCAGRLCSVMLKMLGQKLAGKKRELPGKVFRMIDRDG